MNDLIMLVAFAPIVILLLGVSRITVPYDEEVKPGGARVPHPGHPLPAPVPP